MRRLLTVPAACAAGLLGWIASPAVAASDPAPARAVAGEGGLAPIDPATLRIEAGAVVPTGKASFTIRDPGLRAVVPGTSGSSARLAFVFRGPTQREAPLASGELRRQIGLKLRSQDTCNIVYVMWHVTPDTGVHVQLKYNPGQKTHLDCLDRGYRTLPGRAHRELPSVRSGERHELVARIDGKTLRVLADGRPAWEGELPEQAFAFEGPVGIRSDNGEFDVELWGAAPSGPKGRNGP
jgi:hypothetical protein